MFVLKKLMMEFMSAVLLNRERKWNLDKGERIQLSLNAIYIKAQMYVQYCCQVTPR